MTQPRASSPKRPVRTLANAWLHLFLCAVVVAETCHFASRRGAPQVSEVEVRRQGRWSKSFKGSETVAENGRPGPGLYRIRGTLNFAPGASRVVHLDPDDCLVSARVAGVDVDLSAFQGSARCDVDRGLSMDLTWITKPGANPAEFVLENLGGALRLVFTPPVLENAELMSDYSGKSSQVAWPVDVSVSDGEPVPLLVTGKIQGGNGDGSRLELVSSACVAELIIDSTPFRVPPCDGEGRGSRIEIADVGTVRGAVIPRFWARLNPVRGAYTLDIRPSTRGLANAMLGIGEYLMLALAVVLLGGWLMGKGRTLKRASRRRSLIS